MLRPSRLLALLTVRHDQLAPEDVLHSSLLSLRCLRDGRVCYPADWSIAGAGLSPARKTAAVGCTVVQDKASTVSHGTPSRFDRRLGSFSHGARTLRMARTKLADAHNFAWLNASIRSPSKLSLRAAASTILISALGFVTPKSGLVINLTDSSGPDGIYRLIRKLTAP